MPVRSTTKDNTGAGSVTLPWEREGDAPLAPGSYNHGSPAPAAEVSLMIEAAPPVERY